jgi:hypothetical protein
MPTFIAQKRQKAKWDEERLPLQNDLRDKSLDEYQA